MIKKFVLDEKTDRWVESGTFADIDRAIEYHGAQNVSKVIEGVWSVKQDGVTKAILLDKS